MSVLCLLYYAHSEIVSKNQLHWDLGRGISNFCISRKLKCWTKMCEDLGTSGYVFLVSRKLCIWLTTWLWRLFRAFLYHTLPYRYLQSKSHFTLLSSSFNMAGRHFENFMLYAKSWKEKKKEKKRIEWKWKGKLMKLFSKNISLLFSSTFHSFVGKEITISRVEILISFDIQMGIRQLSFCTNSAFTSVLSP